MTTHEQRAKQGAQYSHAQGALSRFTDRVYVLVKAGRKGSDPEAYFSGIEETETGKAARFTPHAIEAAWFRSALADWWQAALQARYGAHVYAVEIDRPTDVTPDTEYDAREAVEADDAGATGG